MIKLQIELPNEIEEVIKNQGYDVESYVDLILVKPLLDQVKNKEIADNLAIATPNIELLVANIKDNVVVEKQRFGTFNIEITDSKTGDITNTIQTLEVDDNGKVLSEVPKDAKITNLG